MVRSRWWFALSMVGLGSIALWAVAAQTGSPASSVAPGSSEPSNNVPTFQANANLVLVDVVVRDKGKPVEGLPQSDFQVFEDGKPQTVSVFEEHRATDVEQAAQAPVLPPHVYGNFPQYRIESATNVLLLDALNTPLNDQTFTRAQILKYLHTIPRGTQIAVFTLASRLRVISGFTTDVDAIEEALSPEHTPKQKSLMTDPEGEHAEKVAEAGLKAEIPGVTQEVDAFERDHQAFQADQRVDITLGAFGQMARYLSTVPGRKNLIWVSGGLSRALDPDLSRVDTREAARIGSAVRTVNAELARARVAVYPVDARALMTLPNSNSAVTIAPTEGGLAADLAGAEAEGAQNDIETPQKWSDSQSEMKQIAMDTGGAAFYNTNAVGKAVEEAITDGSSYYTLGYAPPAVKENGAYHTIAVHLGEGKYELSYRRGYYVLDPGGLQKEIPILSPITAAMERGVPPLSQVVFEARVLPAGDPELHGLKPTPGIAGTPPSPLQPPVTRYFIDYLVDPRQLALKDLPDGRRQAELEVTQAVYDGSSRRVNFSDAGLEVTQTPAQMARDMQSGLRLRQEIDVPAGAVALRIGVRDATSDRIGTIEMPVGSPETVAANR